MAARKYRELGSIRDVTLFVYPESAYGVPNLGETVNLKTPSAAEVRAGFEKALADNYDFVVIYADEEVEYREIYQAMKSEYEH